MTPTQLQGTITSIHNGTVTLENGVELRVPSCALRSLKLDTRYSFHVCTAQVKYAGLVLFGFRKKANLDRFLQFIALDDSDPVGCLTMVSAGRQPPRDAPVIVDDDADADAIYELVKPTQKILRLTKADAMRAIATTNRQDSINIRAQDAADALAQLAGFDTEKL